MNGLKLLTSAAVCLAAVGAAVVPPTAVSAQQRPAEISWHACYTYPESTLKWLAGPDQLEEFKQLWARTECGTVQVPMDYRQPEGRSVTVA